ncbi:MAG: hypothetical protein H7X95_00900 [Deltaproteobacteria bacterium]|nr:hypothetical protein [Deltaproteobacteria bacterium]
MPAGGTANRLRWIRKWVGPAGLFLVALAGTALFLKQMHSHYPIEKWLFWTYAEAWFYALLFALACLCSGDVVVSRFLRPRPPLRERFLLSLTVGVFVFSTGVFVVGLFHGLGKVFFFAWPLALIASGIQPLIRTIRRAARLLPHARRIAARPSWWGGLALVFGLAGAALLYINIMTPANVAYDARWYHLALAEHYAAAGAVTRFPEGWFCSTYPHLASFLYTWAFLIPAGDLVTKIEIAAHIEFVLFLATLAGVSILVRWCTAAANLRVRNAWAAVFLFPGIFLYDSTLSVAADHILAFFAAPLFLLFRRTLRDWRSCPAVLMGLVMAAALMTKYQAVSLILVPSVVIVFQALRKTISGRRTRNDSTRFAAVWRIPLLLAVSTLVLTTPLWLKNLIWYGDPLYPMLRSIFPAHPWVPGTDPGKLLQIVNWTPQGTLFERIRQTLVATVTFSFVAHDWWNHHGTLPVFGSLFTLCLPMLLFVKRQRRIVGLAAATMIGVAIWYWTYHQDRYLQALLPWMAATVAAALALAWRTGWAGRVAVGGLVVAQVVWGGDVYTIPTHGMIQTQPARMTLDLLSSGYRKDWASRKNAHMEYAAVAPLLPKGSTLLIHERMIHFGHGAKSVIDMPGTQAGISYSMLATPRAVYDLLRRFGVTHILWSRGLTQNFQTSVDDLVFFEFAEKHTAHQTDVAGFVLGEMPAQPPAAVAEPRRVRVQVCGAATARTVYLHQLDAALAGTASAEAVGSEAPAFYVIQSGCAGAAPESTTNYRLLLNRGGYDLWALKTP